MFWRKVDVTIMTRTENEDNFKVMKVIDRIKEVGTILVNCSQKTDDIEIGFVTKKSNVKRLEEDLDLLRSVGIKAEMKIK